MIGIYKITSPTKKIYIGQSIDIQRRFNDYRLLRCKCQPKLYNSLKKHGYLGHIFEIVTLCEVDQLNEFERYYQDCYNVLGKHGLNCLLTTSIDRSGELSKETKNKLSELSKGKKMSNEAKFKMSENAKKRIFSQETRIKMSLAQKGRKLSDETKIKMSKPKSEETILKMKKPKTNETRKVMSESRIGMKYKTKLIKTINYESQNH